MSTENYDTQRVSKELSTFRVGIKSDAAGRIADHEDPAAVIEELGANLGDNVKQVELPHVETALETLQNPTNPDAEATENNGVEGDTQQTPHSDTSINSAPEPTKNNDESDDVPPTDDPISETAPEAGQTLEDIPETPEQESPNLLLEEPEVTEDGIIYIEGGDLITGDTPKERWSGAWENTLLNPPLPDTPVRDTSDRRVEIRGDITGNSRTTGEYEDFQRLFRDRHKRLRKILNERMPPTTTIGTIDDRLARKGKPVGLIGLVNEVRKTKNGHDLIEIEDTTGTFPVLFSKDHTPDPIKDQIDRIIADEVIGFVGSLADDAGILFGDEIYFPDVPPMRTPNKSTRDVSAVLLSDLHFGAVDFAADEWRRFVEWMRSGEAENVEYVLIAGDIVEGIGVYPGQEKELDVVDIYDQYVLCAEALKQLPSDVDIYTIMGNHDTVRLAEPQPVIKDAFKEPFADNVHFAGNPSTISVEGVNFLMYHGMSLNPFTDRTPGLDIHEPTDAMQMMAEKRHLAPMYGMNVRLAPEHEDYLVIEEVPDVIHTGHVHTFGLDTYKNIILANTGCWQYQTDFQKKLNVEPDVGYAPVINLSSLEIDVKQF